MLGRRDTAVTYSLDPIPKGTRMTVRHDGFVGLRKPADEHALKHLPGSCQVPFPEAVVNM